MTATLIPAILAGGKGERFWPMSRRHRPKQFLSLDGSGKSLLQATADRLLEVAGGWSGLWVVASVALAEGIREQLPQLPPENLLAEPEGRDTAAAVAWAAVEIQRRYGDEAVIGFFPADHWIADLESFYRTLRAASAWVLRDGAIATLGVKPTHPATGYGYIEQGERRAIVDGLPVYQVDRFTEKPDLATAEEFLAAGRFSWNSGMFVFPAGLVLQELDAHAPEIVRPLRQEGVAAYGRVPKISIDYALMEKTQKATVFPVSFGWDDLGDWNAIARLLQGKNSLQGENSNVAIGEHASLDTEKCIVYASDEREIVVTIGLEDIAIVRDGNATLVVKRDRTQDIKKVLKQLQADPKYREFL